MSYHAAPPRRDRFSRDGFQKLTTNPSPGESIPMQPVNAYPSSPASSQNEKAKLFNGASGYRRSMVPGRRDELAARGKIGYDEEESTLTAMGRVYNDFMSFSLFTRYLVYILPIGVLLAIPIIVSTSVSTHPNIDGVRLEWLFGWLEVCWIGLWVSKIVAHFLPAIFQFLVGIVSQGTRKYALILAALETTLSFAAWALIALATFKPMLWGNSGARTDPAERNPPEWIAIVQRVLAAALIGTLVHVVEKLIIQLISINYHKKQFTRRIQESKRSIYLLGLLYDASRAMFPQGCPEFTEEDTVIDDSLDLAFGAKKKKTLLKRHGHNREKSDNPLHFMRNVGSIGTKFLSSVAKDITGKEVFDAHSAHSVVLGALEKNRTAEALARRLWLSFVIEGNDALFMDDVREVLGVGREQVRSKTSKLTVSDESPDDATSKEAEECFAALDRDGNGDVSLDEMILAVAEFGRERHAINNSMYDVDQAIKVLDRLLSVIAFIAVVFIFVAFLNTSFVTTLATAGTALLSLSFVFSTTAQEVLGSCIFLFVKHPFDIGDKVEVNQEQLFVEHISLLFTVFRRVSNHQMVQIPNVVLNTLWIENTTRSRAMREQISVPVDFGTSFEDVQLLKSELQKFVLDKDNSRDFFPEVDVQVLGIDKMDKLELRVEVVHKSNWANETVRASRRSKLMCALVLAVRKVPINGPSGGAAALGSADNPAYNVAVSDGDAAAKRRAYEDKQESKRLVPSNAVEVQLFANKDETPEQEKKAIGLINERNLALDGAQDGDDVYRGSNRTETGKSVGGEEGSGVLRRETTKGKRRSGRTLSQKSVSSVRSHWTNANEDGNDVPEMPSIGITPIKGMMPQQQNPMAAYYAQQRDPSNSSNGPRSPTSPRGPQLPAAVYARSGNSSPAPGAHADSGRKEWV